MKIVKKIFLIIVTGTFLYAVALHMFQLSVITGIGFIIACLLPVYRGVVFKEPIIVGYIAVGYTLTNLAISQILPMVFQDFIQGSVLTAIILFVFFLAVYLRGKELMAC